MKPYILAIDSSTSVLRVGLSLKDDSIVSFENTGRYRHSQFIFGMIAKLLADNGVIRPQISAVVVSVGPGSFTGLRVGMAAAKGIATALSINLAGVSTFNAVSPRLFQQFGKTYVLIPSRRDEYYLGLIDAPQFDDRNITVDRITGIAGRCRGARLYGVGCEPDRKILADCEIIRPAEFALAIDDFLVGGISRLAAGGDDIARLEPLYIQQFPAEAKK
ncbi:MAG: tRNA (adenosine(37)-N6)-threonylcarbamoyltransferase complex dimerization subunit type 1 TsaB [Candidatus Zixiibacteriota bacterium]|nr:MAG: tRNA (adenosine(37)-N6)-threonylcarbamoyltransferase complex dimerization subunit type 1 TsaB [candidate division Zixibacteria bacterium]